ncbi:MAG: U32 family peptidase [Zoogloeaceae bacterium]|nr:U32 family peptidase [Zoogloeaceae bacterium]
MPHPNSTLELLAPAKNAEFGIEAIRHGADAVYIGGPAFGARAQAGNSLAEVERLAAFAHRFHARVFVAVNTIFHDHELEDAEGLAWSLYEAGADALIVQDMGLLEMNLPPIQLHASTQTDIRHPEKARFLQDVGFAQIVLARELTLDQIARIRAETDCVLEFFIHGALCVAYSGQCYISHAHTGRSANRGECSQACRLPYDLVGSQGEVLASGRHLLSMKDNDQTANLRALIQAGIRSFKIEGRHKDLPYVKNVTAHYRQQLDAILEEFPDLVRASSGQSSFHFTPVPEKTFNRSTTDYFVQGRQGDIGAFDSPTFTGEAMGEVLRIEPGRRGFTVQAASPLHNGDGLTFFTAKGTQSGLRVNRVEGDRILTAEPVPADLVPGTPLFRNHDHQFLRALERPSAERRIGVSLGLEASGDQLCLTAEDEDGFRARASVPRPGELARDPDRALASLREGLSKLGNTDFEARQVRITLADPVFLPAAQINALRREVISALEAARQAGFARLPPRDAVEPPVPYPEAGLSYLANVLNDQARNFYRKHGVGLIDAAYEAGEERGEVSLMITKHCLRYSFNLCPKEVRGIRPDPMTLVHGQDRLNLRFDCKRCEMHVEGRIKPGVLKGITASPLKFFSSRPAAA